jgi:hypothetical protein
VFGVVLGLVVLAWADVAMAQDAPAAQAMTVPATETELLLRLIAGGGLPAVLGALGWWLPRAISSMVEGLIKQAVAELQAWEPTIHVRLPQGEVDQLAALHDRVDRLVNEIEAARRAPPPPPPPVG